MSAALFDEQPVGGSSSTSSFDDMPLPTASKVGYGAQVTSGTKFGEIADRAKASSIAFDYQVLLAAAIFLARS